MISYNIYTCFLFCIANYCYSTIQLHSRKCGIKLSVVIGLYTPSFVFSCSKRTIKRYFSHFDTIPDGVFGHYHWNHVIPVR